jgi:hypothetical protein
MAYQSITVGHCKLTLSEDGETLIHGGPTVEGEFALDLSGLKGLKIIGESAFAHCKTLTKVVLPNGLEEIGISAFGDCTALASVNLPDSLKHIRGNAFMRCALESITLPENLLTVGMRAFAGCSQLKAVTFSCVALEQAHPGAFMESDPRFILRPVRRQAVLASLFRTNFYKRFGVIENIYAMCRFPLFANPFHVRRIADRFERHANQGFLFCVLLCAHRIHNLSMDGSQAKLPRLPLLTWIEILGHVRWKPDEQKLWRADEEIVRCRPDDEGSWRSRLLSGEISLYPPLIKQYASFFEVSCLEDIAAALAGQASEAGEPEVVMSLATGPA